MGGEIVLPTTLEQLQAIFAGFLQSLSTNLTGTEIAIILAMFSGALLLFRVNALGSTVLKVGGILLLIMVVFIATNTINF